MAVLQSTNVQGTLCVNGVAIGGGKDFYFCCVSGSGTYTPSSGLVSADGVLDITLVGGGGGGSLCSCCTSGCGAGGGGGAIFQGIRVMTSSADACTLTVGAGGSGQTSVNTIGNNGGDTIFDQCLLPGAIAFGGGGGGNCRGTGGGPHHNTFMPANNNSGRNSGAGGGAFSAGVPSGGSGATQEAYGGEQRVVPVSSSLDTNPAGAVGFSAGALGNGCNAANIVHIAGQGLRDMGNGGVGMNCGVSGRGGATRACADAGGFGNGGGGGKDAGTGGDGSDGIIILKWAE